MRIWYIYPPAGGPNLGRYWRAYLLAQHWLKRGSSPLVIVPGYHHHFPDNNKRRGQHNIQGVPYFFLSTPRYGENLVQRTLALLQMAPALVLSKGLRHVGKVAPPDVIIYSSPYPFGIIGAWLLARRYSAKLILEVRDLWPMSLTQVLGTPRWHPVALISDFCERLGYKRAHRVVSLLAGAKAYMVSRGLQPCKFAYIPNGMDDTVSGDACDHPLLQRAKVLREEGRFIVLHAGNVGKTTPLETLLDAAQKLQDQNEHAIHFLIVGRGESARTLMASAKQRALRNIEFHEQVDRRVALTLMRQVDLGFASFKKLPIYDLGVSPNKVYDYMSVGLPVLFAHTEAPNQITSTGGALGCDVEDASAIRDLLLQFASMTHQERRLIGNNGRQYVSANHNYAKLAVDYLALMSALRG